MSTELPTFNNGITPQAQPQPPQLTEPVPRDPEPMTDAARTANTHHMNISVRTQYQSPTEAIAGSGSILGVQSES